MAISIIHSDATRIPSLPAEVERESSLPEEIAGCILREADDPGETEYYEILPLERIEEMIDSNEVYIFGSHVDDLELELQRKHPAPDDMTYVYRKRYLETRYYDYPGYSDRRRWHTKTINGWVVLKHPFCEPISLEELYGFWVRAEGPVLIPERQFHPEELDAFGFTTQKRINDMWYVNFNPRAIELREYRKQRKEAQGLLSGCFLQETIDNLFEAVCPDRMPHDYDDLIHGYPRHESRGWGRTSTNHSSVDQILNALELAKKLGVYKERYWREWETRYGQTGFKHALEEALWRVYGVEDKYKSRLEEHREEQRKDYAVYVTGFAKDPSQYSTEEPIPYSEYYKPDKCCMRMLRFCRWLRSEARACKIRMPGRPKIPNMPVKLKKKKKRRRKRSKVKKSKKP